MFISLSDINMHIYFIFSPKSFEYHHRFEICQAYDLSHLCIASHLHMCSLVRLRKSGNLNHFLPCEPHTLTYISYTIITLKLSSQNVFLINLSFSHILFNRTWRKLSQYSHSTRNKTSANKLYDVNRVGR